MSILEAAEMFFVLNCIIYIYERFENTLPPHVDK